MLAEEQKLRWCGMDMRPRRRRRAAVLGTYAVLFIVCVKAASYLSHPGWTMFGLIVVVQLLVWLSIMRSSGIVKRFEPKRPMRLKGMGDVVLVEGLDGWAQHFHGAASFEAASPEQQADILSRFKFGARWFPVRAGESDSPWLDEREVKERDSAERWSGQQVMVLLASYAGVYTARAIDQRPVTPWDVAVAFFMFAVLAQTLPRARVLWTEDDPREEFGELHLVDVT
jgi:hypothetical protein